MALSIGISENSRIRVGSKVLRVAQIQDNRHIHIIYDGQRHLITDEERTEVEKGVFISCGIKSDRATSNNFSRLAFEAPREVLIQRLKS